MKNKLTLLLLLLTITNAIHAQQNITFRSKLSYPGIQLANIGGYADPSGNEYALVGTSIGLSIVDVTNPVSPVEIIAVPGISSIWREVKTFGHYAYVTTEGGGGLQIVNLQYLPDSVQVKQYTGDGIIAGQLSNIHALHIEDGFVYLFGGSLFGGAAKICDLNPDPWNPVYQGHTSGPYIHDGYVRNDTLWAAHIYGGYFGVHNVADKANPILLTTQNTPNNFTHNTWLSTNGRTLFTTDETSNSFLTSYDVSDISNIQELDRIQIHPGDNSAIHNTHIKNNYAVTSWYNSGVSIVDVSKPASMVQIGFYDTSPNSGSGYNGCWGVYPFLPSGNILASDMQQGLYVLTPNYVRACHLTGTVKDKISGSVINNVLVEIIGGTETTLSKPTGKYSTGLATAGTYSVKFSKAGYVTKIKTGVILTNNVFKYLNISLEPTTFKINPVADAYVRSGSFAGTNFGSAIKLYTKSGSNLTDSVRESYLRFNISSIDSFVSNAKLRLYAAMNSAASLMADVEVRQAIGNTWTETGITYNNKPGISAVVSGTQTITGTTFTYYEWDITTLVQQSKTAGDTLISLALNCPSLTPGNFVKIYSRENTINKPQLVVTAGSLRSEAPNQAFDNTGSGQNILPFDATVSGNKIILKNIKAESDFTMTLYDVTGRFIYGKEISREVLDFEINLPALVNGIYLVNFRNRQFNHTKKYLMRGF